MTTLNSVTTIITETWDPTLSHFHDQREFTYKGTKEKCEMFIPIFEKSLQELSAFEARVNARGSELQHERVTLPSKEELEKEKLVFLEEYWESKKSFQKVSQFAKNLDSVIIFLTPKLRIYSEEEVLKRESPELYEQVKRSEEIASGHIRELGNFLGKVCVIRDKMISVFTTRVDSSVQRFCQIASKGNPLNWLDRAYNYSTAPLIPKLILPTQRGDASPTCSEPTSPTDSETVSLIEQESVPITDSKGVSSKQKRHNGSRNSQNQYYVSTEKDGSSTTNSKKDIQFLVNLFTL